MDGGSVTGNKSISKFNDLVGGAVFAAESGAGSIVIGGNTVIKNNVWKCGSTTKPSDLRINTGKELTIGNGANECLAPKNGMEIGAFLCSSTTKILQRLRRKNLKHLDGMN